MRVWHNQTSWHDQLSKIPKKQDEESKNRRCGEVAGVRSTAAAHAVRALRSQHGHREDVGTCKCKIEHTERDARDRDPSLHAIDPYVAVPRRNVRAQIDDVYRVGL